MLSWNRNITQNENLCFLFAFGGGTVLMFLIVIVSRKPPAPPPSSGCALDSDECYPLAGSPLLPKRQQNVHAPVANSCMRPTHYHTEADTMGPQMARV